MTQPVNVRNHQEFLKVEFNITLPKLACRFISVDVDDVLGASSNTRTSFSPVVKAARQGRTSATCTETFDVFAWMPIHTRHAIGLGSITHC